MEKLRCDIDQFIKLANDPALFLTTNTKKSHCFVKLCASIYEIAKLYNKSSDVDPLRELYIDGFDDEQIWQQIDIFNNENIKSCSKGASLCLNNWVQLLHNPNTENSEPIEDSENKSDEEDDEDASESDEQLITDKVVGAKENFHNDKEEFFEKTEVDDEFFSLRKMEKFLEAAESGKLDENSDNDIDYFDDIPSTDDENGWFDNDSNGDSSENSDVVDASGKEESDGEVDANVRQSARNIRYDDFFLPANFKKEVEVKKEETFSKYQKQQINISERIKTLEEQALGEQSWQMKGETVASKRPVNSLLEEVLTFDHSQRLAPEITDEHTHNLETIICQRIKDKSWDDVEKKIKETKDPSEYKKKVVLDSEQSKLSLHEIYEKEYLNKTSKETPEDKDNPAHAELNDLMGEIFQQLDALSHYHFRSVPPEPEIKVLTNLPSVAMEDVQPVTHTDADVLAPEEVHKGKEIKEDAEKTPTDRKRERRKKVARQKVRARARLQRLEKLADSNEKLKTVKAVKQLEQAAKHASGQTTIIKSSDSRKSRQISSKTFFGQLDSKSKKPPIKR